jgi:hypothetical protein
VTEIREHGFSLDLPGEWVQVDADEPGALLYRQAGCEDVVRVMLLSVRPMFTIADQMRLLADYVQHRSTYEMGLRPTLKQLGPFFEEGDDGAEAWWGSEGTGSPYRQQHRALLVNHVLADVCYSSLQPDQAVFDERAEEILATLAVAVE